MNKIILQQIIEEYQKENISLLKLAKKYGVGHSSLCKEIKKLGLTRSQEDINLSHTLIANENDRKDIIYRYTVLRQSCITIGEIYNVSRGTIEKILKEANVKLGKNGEILGQKRNDSFFKNIDTPNKAYILGFLYADGYVQKDGKYVRLTLAEYDKEILEKIEIAMRIEVNLNLLKARKKNQANQYQLTLCKAEGAKYLIEHGCTPHKTFDIRFPTWLSDELMPHFIRGYFDGDGSIASQTAKRANINFCSNPIFIQEAQKYLNEKLNIETYISCPQNSNISYLCFGNKEAKSKFMEYIYKNADLYMERKYQCYLYWKNRNYQQLSKKETRQC